MERATAFDILPAIDIRGGHVVRLEEGDFARETVFGDDPATIAAAFADAGAAWIHVVDRDGARQGTATGHRGVDGIIAAVGQRLHVEVAGGLRDEAAIRDALTAGAARAVVGTAAIREPGFAGRLVAAHGPGRIAVAIDVRGDRAVGDAWSTSDPGVDALDAIRRLADEGVEVFEVTAIERDGLLSGPNLALYERMIRLGRGAIIASGGIATIADLAAIRALGCAGAIIGRALYTGRISLPEALEVGTG